MAGSGQGKIECQKNMKRKGIARNPIPIRLPKCLVSRSTVGAIDELVKGISP